MTVPAASGDAVNVHDTTPSVGSALSKPTYTAFSSPTPVKPADAFGRPG
jgi:hypothetical protein